MHILIGIAALVALLLLIRTLYYATLLMRPHVQAERADRRARRLQAELARKTEQYELRQRMRARKRQQTRECRLHPWQPGMPSIIVALLLVFLAAFGPLLLPH